MKDIKGFEGLYAVTEDGQVWSYPKQNNRNLRGRWMKQQPHKGYLSVHLKKDGKIFSKLVHRLVAETFIPNPENRPQVNHKHEDGNKARNLVDNLEWTTNKENSDHAFKVNLMKKPLTAGEVIELRKICQFNSCRKVALAYGRNPGNIWAINKGYKYQEVSL
ncbi:MAG: NUMOD4 domain-containing protein [Pseudorhodobacter sp.]|nr:NUMOD4 domain-containing protein [Pseudorhodobacter sp.]